MLHGWETKDFHQNVGNILLRRNTWRDKFPACNTVLDKIERNVFHLGRGLLVHGHRERSITFCIDFRYLKSSLLIRPRFLVAISQNSLRIQLNYFTQSNLAMYSASPLEVAISVCFLVLQATGVPWIEMIQPEVYFRVSLQPLQWGSQWARMDLAVVRTEQVYLRP